MVHIHISTNSEKTEWVIDMQSDTNAALKKTPVVIQNIINACPENDGSKVGILIPKTFLYFAKLVLIFFAIFSSLSFVLDASD